MRRDLFAEANAVYSLKDLIHSLEKCDCCGAQVPMYLTTFTGRQFLCGNCLRQARDH